MAPTSSNDDFKGLFRRLAEAGAGRPTDKDGFPMGPWTPELLAEAIAQIDTNGSGVDLRTTQLWFQDNDRESAPKTFGGWHGCSDAMTPRRPANGRLNSARREDGLLPKGRSEERREDRIWRGRQTQLRSSAELPSRERHAMRSQWSQNAVSAWQENPKCCSATPQR